MTYLAANERDSAQRELEKALELAGDNDFAFRDNVEQALKSM